MREVNTIFKILIKGDHSFTVEHEFETLREVMEFSETIRNEGIEFKVLMVEEITEVTQEYLNI